MVFACESRVDVSDSDKFECFVWYEVYERVESTGVGNTDKKTFKRAKPASVIPKRQTLIEKESVFSRHRTMSVFDSLN